MSQVTQPEGSKARTLPRVRDIIVYNNVGEAVVDLEGGPPHSSFFAQNLP
jgi:hypothetical protein